MYYLINKLPEELKREILTYTYQPQDKKLCEQIREFNLKSLRITFMHAYYSDRQFYHIIDRSFPYIYYKDVKRNFVQITAVYINKKSFENHPFSDSVYLGLVLNNTCRAFKKPLGL